MHIVHQQIASCPVRCMKLPSHNLVESVRNMENYSLGIHKIYVDCIRIFDSFKNVYNETFLGSMTS